MTLFHFTMVFILLIIFVVVPIFALFVIGLKVGYNDPRYIWIVCSLMGWIAFALIFGPKLVPESWKPVARQEMQCKMVTVYE